MKKWNNPQLIELGLEKTEDSACNVDFTTQPEGRTPGPVFCDKNAYKATSIFDWTCVHYTCGKCTYQPTGQQS